MNSKTSIALNSLAIAAVVLLFASGPIIGNHQALGFGDNHHPSSLELEQLNIKS